MFTRLLPCPHCGAPVPVSVLRLQKTGLGGDVFRCPRCKRASALDPRSMLSMALGPMLWFAAFVAFVRWRPMSFIDESGRHPPAVLLAAVLVVPVAVLGLIGFYRFARLRPHDG